MNKNNQEIKELLSKPAAQTIFRQTFIDSIKNIGFFGTVVVVIVIIGSFVRWLGAGLFAIFALTTLIDIFRLLIAIGLGILMLPVKILLSLRNHQLAKDEIYLWGATLVQGVQFVVFIGYNVFLYVHFLR